MSWQAGRLAIANGYHQWRHFAPAGLLGLVFAMKCPDCGRSRIVVYSTNHPDPLTIYRYRKCLMCDFRWVTSERLYRSKRQLRSPKTGRFLKVDFDLPMNKPTALIDRAIEAYWHIGLDIRGIHSRQRMQKVFELIAKEIQEWAPAEDHARICHLAIMEVAQRLQQEGLEHIRGIDSAASPAPSASGSPSDQSALTSSCAFPPDSVPAAPGPALLENEIALPATA